MGGPSSVSSHSSERPIPSPRPRSASPAASSFHHSQRQATVRLGSPVTGNAFPQQSTGTSTPVHGGPTPAAPAPQNPFAVFNFPPAMGGTPPRFSTPPRFGTPPRFSTPPLGGRASAIAMPGANDPSASRAASVHYGSFDSRAPIGDPEIVRRHLVTDDDAASGYGSDATADEFSSLQLLGGDITRPIYRYVDHNTESATATARRGRSLSFQLPRPEPEHVTEDISHIKAIGGFRRDFLHRAQGPAPHRGFTPEGSGFFTRNFIEFLTLHGHFAGEDLEDDEGWDPESDEGSDVDPLGGRGIGGIGGIGAGGGDDGDRGRGGGGRRGGADGDEERPLISRRGSLMKKSKIATGTAGSKKAVLLLLKSFVGTGVLFLPKAYLNGGMLFSNLVLLFVSALSYYCFVLLVRTRLKVVGSFGDIGGQLYGPTMRFLILSSIVVSQIGFAAAYIVFTSENLQAFVAAVSKGSTFVDVKWFILTQLLIFLPFSMIRDMAKLGGTALVADLFIMMGLVYLYYYDLLTLATSGVADVVAFNPNSWTLFIGTAIFTFEGIGLIIPIQETMKHPEKFPRVLGGVMVVITLIFVSMGALCYAAYGSATKTVVILNLPQDSKSVNAVQFLYSLAILLSTPLQLFPAIRIMETGMFPRSGKFNTRVKWSKNCFRFLVVLGTGLIAWGGADDLDKFVAIIGSFACIPLVYIYPPLLHMRAYPGRGWLAHVIEGGLCIFGFAVMVYTTALTAWKWRDPNQ